MTLFEESLLCVRGRRRARLGLGQTMLSLH